MEAAKSSSASSRVIIQCSDPHNLFDRVLPELKSHQPLGNLHWKSSTRPLRSINSLHVSFVREVSNVETSNTTRRHQIPGLRQTPFVKLLLLQCDDRELYKDTARKEVKQWLKAHGLSADGRSWTKGQERHDAFEYMIVHVVLPNTPAANQPKSSKHISIEASESTDSVNSKSKWTGKPSSTVYDKLRADFSSSSKAPFERVAQVRIVDAGSKPNAILTSSEIEDLWQDFVEKLKSAILASFDARVAQYEDDIRDRDKQRNLPGWNFCTFFILKEGLARGFENVGLNDDALTVYDELDVGLDGILRNQSTRGDVDAAGVLLPFSIDLKPAIRSALQGLQDDTRPSSDLPIPEDLSSLIELAKGDFPFDTTKIDYQQRILTNQVSALDLRIYIFTRKFQLLFRKAVSVAPATSSRSSGDTSEQRYDVGVLSDICEQSLSFISFASRALRQDLYHAWGGQNGLDIDELKTQRFIISNLVASWKVSAIMQVFHDCRVFETLSSKLPNLLGSSSQHDQGKSSSITQSNGHPYPPSSQQATTDSLSGQLQDSNAINQIQSTSIPLHKGLEYQKQSQRIDSHERLALWSAELLAIAHDVVGAFIVKKKDAITYSLPAVLVDRGDEGLDYKHNNSGLQAVLLRIASATPDIRVSIYKMLTSCTYYSYAFARQTQASYQMLLDLATTELDNQRPDLALYWLDHISQLPDLQASTVTDLSVLILYTQCLSQQELPERYLKGLLSIIRACSTSIGIRAVNSAKIKPQQIFDELVMVSDRIETTQIPLHPIFVLDDIDDGISHRPDRDGFVLSCSISLNLTAEVTVKEPMLLELVAANDGEPRHVTLKSDSSLRLSPKKTTVRFESDFTTQGLYHTNSVLIRIGNTCFKHNFLPASVHDGIERPLVPRPAQPIVLYPRAGALSIRAYRTPVTDLTKPSSIRLGVGVGENTIQQASFRIRPATAGVRLDIHQTELQDREDFHNFEIVQVDGISVIHLTGLPQHTVVFDVPYMIEGGFTDTVQVKFHATYHTLQGQFEAFFTESIHVLLPISINVQETFQQNTIFSRFTAGSATIVPLEVVSWQIEPNDFYHIRSSVQKQEPVQVFPRQSASWVVQISEKGEQHNVNGKMPLIVQYRCLDDLILQTIEEMFLADLQVSPLASASSLLVHHLSNKIPSLWSELQLEAAALLREIEMWGYKAVGWEMALKGLSHKARPEAEQWLKEWHKRHEHVALTPASAPIRVLRLSVDVPKPLFIISTQLQIRYTSNVSDSIAVGQAIQAMLVFSCDRDIPKTTELQYEVKAHNDTWLVGGKKRGALSMATRSCKIPIILMAQRVGRLLLPSVEVQYGHGEDANGSSTQRMQVEHRSQAQSVLIVSRVQTTTIALEPDESAGYSLLADRQR